jgi:hypothetical protein
MLEHAKRAGEIKGLVPHLVEGGITHVQYTDDTIIFLDLDEQSIIYTKFLLYCFEDMSGLKINYEKSEIYVLGALQKKRRRLRRVLTVRLGSFL